MEKCRYCEEGYGLKSIGDDDCSLEINDSEMQLSIWEGYRCTMVFNTRYCPICGRKLY